MTTPDGNGNDHAALQARIDDLLAQRARLFLEVSALRDERNQLLVEVAGLRSVNRVLRQRLDELEGER